MTELLEKAIAKIKQLTTAQQDAIATRILAELQDEQNWDSCFANTTDEQWERMTQRVRQEIMNGETVTLDEIFPSEP